LRSAVQQGGREQLRQHSAFFDPPSEGRAHWDIEQELRPTKLKDAPPIEYGGDLRHVRYRKPVR